MFKKIILSLAMLVSLLAVIGLLLPRHSHIERSIHIERPPSMVYGVVNSFALFPRWSPWQHLDPDMVQTASGPPEGVGATLKWSGNKKVGTGTQVITATMPNESVTSDLTFGDMGTSKATISLSGVGAGTTVRWTLDSDMGAGPVGRYFGLMMDSMVGGDFETGLKNLKSLLESMPSADLTGFQVRMVDLEAQPVLLVNKSVPADAVAVTKAYGDAYAQIEKFMSAHHLKMAGAPFGVDLQANATTMNFDAGIPVDAAAPSVATTGADADGAVRAGSSYAGKAAMTVQLGSYDKLRKTYQQLAAYVAVHGLKANGHPFSRFVDDPMKTPLDQLRTEVYWPVQ